MQHGRAHVGTHLYSLGEVMVIQVSMADNAAPRQLSQNTVHVDYMQLYIHT